MLERAGIALRTAGRSGDTPAAPAGAGGCTVLILDTALLGADQTIKAFVERVERVQAPTIPPPLLVVIAHSHAIEWRLQAMRADAAAFFRRATGGRRTGRAADHPVPARARGGIPDPGGG